MVGEGEGEDVSVEVLEGMEREVEVLKSKGRGLSLDDMGNAELGVIETVRDM